MLVQFAEANILRASGKEEEARTLRVSVSALKNQRDTLEKQVKNLWFEPSARWSMHAYQVCLLLDG